MQHTGSILIGLVALVVVGYLAYRVRKERRELREKIAVFKNPHNGLVESVERLVLSGQLSPVGAG